MHAPSPKPVTSNRFTPSLTLDGYEVCDLDGRPVTGTLEYSDAALAASTLNEAARQGHRSLATALGCVEDDINEGILA